MMTKIVTTPISVLRAAASGLGRGHDGAASCDFLVGAVDLCRRHLRVSPGLPRAGCRGGVALISFWLSGPAGLWVTAGYTAAYAAYCLANLARCREAHCVVTH